VHYKTISLIISLIISSELIFGVSAWLSAELSRIGRLIISLIVAKYQPDSSNRSISLIISLILVIVRTQLLCAAASGLMLRSTSRRDATADNIWALYFLRIHMSTHPYVTRSATAAAAQQGDSTRSSCRTQQPAPTHTGTTV